MTEADTSSVLDIKPSQKQPERDLSSSYLEVTRTRKSSVDMSSILETSIIIENTLAVTRTDCDGNKYLNQYMLLDKLGKYPRFSHSIEEITG